QRPDALLDRVHLAVAVRVVPEPHQSSHTTRGENALQIHAGSLHLRILRPIAVGILTGDQQLPGVVRPPYPLGSLAPLTDQLPVPVGFPPPERDQPQNLRPGIHTGPVVAVQHPLPHLQADLTLSLRLLQRLPGVVLAAPGATHHVLSARLPGLVAVPVVAALGGVGGVVTHAGCRTHGVVAHAVAPMGSWRGLSWGRGQCWQLPSPSSSYRWVGPV